MKKAILLASIIFLFAGCAQAPINRPLTYNEFTGTGLVVGSITFKDDKPGYNAYMFYMAALEGDDQFKKDNFYTIKINPEQTVRMKFKGELNNGKTYLFAFDRPPGKYAMTAYQLFRNGGYVTSSTVNKTRFEIPYEVKKGAITYIGELEFTERGTISGSTIKISDNFERDINGLKTKAPAINWAKAVNNTVKSGIPGNTVKF